MGVGVGVREGAEDALNAVEQDFGKAIGDAGAMLTSLNRANGALDAGNDFWEQAQLQATDQYASQLSADLSALPALLTNLQSAIQASGLPAASVTLVTPYFDASAIAEMSARR